MEKRAWLDVFGANEVESIIGEAALEDPRPIRIHDRSPSP